MQNEQYQRGVYFAFPGSNVKERFDNILYASLFRLNFVSAKPEVPANGLFANKCRFSACFLQTKLQFEFFINKGGLVCSKH